MGCEMEHIYKTDNGENSHDEGSTQTQTPECDHSIGNAGSIQQLLPKQHNQQITTNRETNPEPLEGEGEMSHINERVTEDIVRQHFNNDILMNSDEIISLKEQEDDKYAYLFKKYCDETSMRVSRKIDTFMKEELEK